MDNEYLYKEVSFIKKEDIIEKMADSLSGALTLKIIKNNKNYFFKLYDNKEGEIKRIKDICNIYSSVTDHSLHMIDSGITSDNKVWFVFNWIDGLALNKLYDSHHDFYEYGYSIGKIFKNIYKNSKKEDITNDSMIQEALKAKEEFNLLYEKEELLNKNFSKDTLVKINKAFSEYLSMFDNIEQEYIHGDMDPKNVMIDNNNNVILIDIEGFSYNYFIYNLRWSIILIYKQNQKENKDFFRGFIKGRYEDDIPSSINKQLIFILLLKFYSQMVIYYNLNRLDMIEQQISLYNKLFSQLDLSGNISILDV